jgi:parvulin-like peptidyl-prolyl isomerase
MAERLASLRAGTAAPCDPHLAGQEFRGRTDRQLRAALGDEVTDAIVAAAAAEWTGPIEAPRGLYAVRVTEREASALPPLDVVRDAVRDAVVEEARQRAVAAREAEIAARYEVVRR